MLIITGFILPVLLFLVSLLLKSAMRKAEEVLGDGKTSPKTDLSRAKQLAINTARRIIRGIKVALYLIKSITVVIEALTAFMILAIVIIVVVLIAAIASAIGVAMSSSSKSSTTDADTGKDSHTSSNYTDWFWVGDSRTVGMATTVLGKTATGSASDTIIDDTVAAKVGEGYSWWSSDAMKSTREEVEALKGYNIVFNLGVNDLVASTYIDYYTSLPDSFYDDNNVIFMSINPVCHSKSGVYTTVTNSDIVMFNDALKSAVSDKGVWVDTFKEVFGVEVSASGDTFKDTGMFTEDGLHYTADTYKLIYEYVTDMFKPSEESTTETTASEATTSVETTTKTK